MKFYKMQGIQGLIDNSQSFRCIKYLDNTNSMKLGIVSLKDFSLVFGLRIVDDGEKEGILNQLGIDDDDLWIHNSIRFVTPITILPAEMAVGTSNFERICVQFAFFSIRSHLHNFLPSLEHVTQDGRKCPISLFLQLHKKHGLLEHPLCTSSRICHADFRSTVNTVEIVTDLPVTTISRLFNACAHSKNGLNISGC